LQRSLHLLLLLSEKWQRSLHLLLLHLQMMQMQ
jgi:hypothetical protein